MKLEFDSNLPGLLSEVLNNDTCSVLRTPINITFRLLAELARIAIRVDDPELHIMMLRLGLYDMPNKKRVATIKKLRSELQRRRRLALRCCRRNDLPSGAFPCGNGTDGETNKGDKTMKKVTAKKPAAKVTAKKPAAKKVTKK